MHREGRRGRLNLHNSIIAGRSAASLCSARIEQNVGNLIEDWSCNPEYGGDPMLERVEGPSLYFAPRDDSPAINAAYEMFCPPRDQIGRARPFGGACDIGAVESTSAGATSAGPLVGVCTLRDRILAANSNQAVGACPAGTDHDIIHITEDITLRLPLPPITGDVTIEGGGHTINGDGKFRIFLVNGGNLTVNNLTLTEGFSEDGGGAIHVRNGGGLAVNGSFFTNNSAGLRGGAIDLTGSTREVSSDPKISNIVHSSQGSGLTVNNSSFINNKSGSGGGAMTITGTTSISNSSFIENRAGHSGGAVSGYGDTSISNSTFSGNRAWRSGALHVSGDVTLTHLTIVDSLSSSSYEGSGRTLSADGNVRLRNSIIAGRVGRGQGRLCADYLVQNVGNIIEDGSCLAPMSGDAGLGALTGAPAHYPLLDGSRAVDSADERFCPATDQLGRPRPQSGGCDIGAIESTAASPAAGGLPTDCALLDQIRAANTDQAAGSCPAGRGTDTISLTRDISLDAALPPITSEIKIEGNGYTINGAGKFRIFDVDGGALTLENVSLDGGKASVGGAIRLINGARLTASNLSFTGNVADYGGAIASESADAVLNLSNSIFVGNSGGALLVNGGSVDIGGSAFLANSAGEGQVGGAIETRRGSATISNSIFSGNRAGTGGANCSQNENSALTHVSLLDEGAQRIAGGIYYHSGSLTLRNSIAAGLNSCDN